MIWNFLLQIQIFTDKLIVELFYTNISKHRYFTFNSLSTKINFTESILIGTEPTHELYQFDSFSNNFFQIKSKTSDFWLYWNEDPMRNYKINIQTRNSLSTAWAEANNFPGGFFLRTYFFTTDPFEPTSIKYVGLDCPCPN